ncbi:MAG: hypothetical protein GX217_05920 [Clostridiaceae bacterium]|nr:hypothetical protein [Clostridiaceae bacterium]
MKNEINDTLQTKANYINKLRMLSWITPLAGLLLYPVLVIRKMTASTAANFWINATAMVFFFSFHLITVIYLRKDDFSKINFRGKKKIDLADSTSYRFSLTSSLIALCLALLFTLLTLFIPEHVFVAVYSGEKIPILDLKVLEEVKPQMIVLCIAVLLNILLIIFAKKGRLTNWLSSLILNIITAYMIFEVYLADKIMNVEFMNIITSMFPDKPVIEQFFVYTPYWVCILMLALSTASFNHHYRQLINLK